MAPLRLPSIPKSLLNTPDPSTTGLKSASTSGTSNEVNTLRMNDEDIQQTAKFVREFVSMSLVPWMEKCVADWNENVTPFLTYLVPYVDSCMLPVRLDTTATFPSFFLHSSSVWLWDSVSCTFPPTYFISLTCHASDSVRVPFLDIKYLCWGTSSSKSAETTSRICRYTR